MHILGIDVSKAKLDVALRRPDGKWRSKVIENTPAGFGVLRDWPVSHGVSQVHVCLEATGTYWEAVAEYWADAGHTVSEVNPAQIKAFGGASLTRSKTDRVDARLIADFCAAQHPPPWQAPPRSVRTLRALIARREALDAMRTQERNRLPVADAAVRAGIEAHLAHLEQAIPQTARSGLVKRCAACASNGRLKPSHLGCCPGVGLERLQPRGWGKRSVPTGAIAQNRSQRPSRYRRGLDLAGWRCRFRPPLGRHQTAFFDQPLRRASALRKQNCQTREGHLATPFLGAPNPG